MNALVDLLMDATDSALINADGAPFTAHVAPGAGRLAVVAGANASGKSLFVQIVAGRAHRQQTLAVSISIRERTGAGTHEMAGFRRSMMFGDESEQSTGATSVATVKKAFLNLLNYAQERPVLLILDEPEMGLSEDYAAAMGTWLARETLRLPADQPNLLGVVVVSHSRPLVRAMARELATVDQALHFVGMDGGPSLTAWLDDATERTVEDLLALPALGTERRKIITRLLDDKKPKRPTPRG